VEYSPIPGTPMFARAKKASPFDIEEEPLFHNNSILPCQWEGFSPADFRRLKDSMKGRPGSFSPGKGIGTKYF